jgi:hypothetical protein
MATLREIRERRAKQQKPSLADLRARKQEQKAEGNGLAALRARKRLQKQQPTKRSKQDFAISGVRFHNVQQMPGYWTIDVSNGDQTYTLHNRHGAWFHDIDHSGGRMAEPVRVAIALGTGMGQLEISQALTARLEAELKARGIPTREQRMRIREQEEAAKRRKNRNKDDNDE